MHVERPTAVNFSSRQRPRDCLEHAGQPADQPTPDLTPALPRDNLFYAWPHNDPSRVLNVVWKYTPEKRHTYDILSAAHVRYGPNFRVCGRREKDTFAGHCQPFSRCLSHFPSPSYVPEALDMLVADPLYITVLRSPLTHVKSSFSYWGVASHIRNSE
jgi:hypothetical protein